MKKAIVVSVVLMFIVAAGGIQSAQATPMLKLYDGSFTVLVEDGCTTADVGTNPNCNAVDGDTTTGSVAYIGSIGNFNVNVTTGVTYPVIGSLTNPQLDMSSINVSSSSGGTLDVYFSEKGFGSTPFAPFISEIGGVAGYKITGRTYVNDSNTLFGGTLLDTLGEYNAGSFSGTATSGYSPSDPYSLTTRATIIHSAGGQSTSLNLKLSVVPEPVSSALFIVGAATLGIAGYRRRNK